MVMISLALFWFLPQSVSRDPRGQHLTEGGSHFAALQWLGRTVVAQQKRCCFTLGCTQETAEFGQLMRKDKSWFQQRKSHQC